MAYRTNLLLCTCTMCVSVGALKVKKKLEEELKKHNLQDEIQIVPTGSSWLCTRGPTLIVQPDDVVYQFLKEDDIPYLVEEHLLKGRPVKALMYQHPEALVPIEKLHEIPFYRDQRLIALWNRGIINPENIDEYIGREGYQALAKVLSGMKPDEVIQVIKDSGLRGRGGGGFPTGRKWEFAFNNPEKPKYLICNADEGDPGAFMDRSIIEADPHSLIEGMTIAGYAIGANKGFVYARIEYPLAIKRLQQGIESAREYGLLGKGIFGSDFDFDLEIFRGAGAFVCGEETSLIHSIEGQPAEPRQRPPFPVQQGLFGQPTVINNVETLANVPRIINFGAKWFSSIGTETSKGTKVFSLAGDIINAGLVEVPMGITLRQMVYDIGGGLPNDKKFKAVQTGGPSGGVIPSTLLDLPVDYERLQEADAIMGSGGMIVMDEDNCMVDVAKYFLKFTNDESCGKCTSCREGSKVMLDILTRITRGEGREGDIEFLEELCYAIRDASQCGLGQTLPNPVLSSIKHFRKEYEEHIKFKRCNAAICTEIISSPCQHTCPIETEAATYIALTAQRKYREALEIVRKDNPLPGVCGRVCHHPCESKCRAGEGGQPIAIRDIKRFLTDYGKEHNFEHTLKPLKKRTEKVAVVGSGPAGLAAANSLAIEGYQVTVFEALPMIGGMLRAGIPPHRLPRDILDYDLEPIRKIVDFKTNTRLGKDFNLEDLFEQGYKAVFLALGAHKSTMLGIPGEESEGVLGSMPFLTMVNLGHEVNIGKRIGIIGGGNSAVDAARVAQRLPEVEEVTIIYRRTQKEMPAYAEEVEQALEEGIKIVFLAAPTKIITKDGKLSKVECIRIELGEMDNSGRRRPVPIEGSEFTMELDTLIRAISEQPETGFISDKDGLELTRWGTIVVNEEYLSTPRQGIFAGGDVVTGPNTVIEAIAAGKLAAEMIGKYLDGQELNRTYTITRPSQYPEPVELSEDELDEATRPEMPLIPPSERAKNFKEVARGYTEEMVIKEARRCLRCDLETEDGKKAVGRS
ncbi:FAD-dependent oxidoreductase [bacterium]|nr:FAD-dependent oxidoreductase [bacterium]